jgi:lipopolysaccharide biosynthesis glycosyltransferase
MVAPHTRGYRKIKKFIGQNNKLIWRTVSKKQNPYADVNYSRWSPVIFYRLFAHIIFPNTNKMLYLDSDTLVQSDLSDLYNTDISQYAMGAIRDMAPTNIKDDPNGTYVREFKDKYLKHNLYVNSGVLLLNMEHLRTTQSPWPIKCELTYPDQDILNTMFDGNILELPLRYNCIPEIYVDTKFKPSERNYVQQNICIAHFYSFKPYHYNLVPLSVYSSFTRTAAKIDLYPEDFIKQEHRKIQKMFGKHNPKTNIPFLTVSKKGTLRLFGLKMN